MSTQPTATAPTDIDRTPITPPAGARVLVVDDHRKIRDPLALYLRRFGFKVATAENAADMWLLLRHDTFDVVVLDVMLPDGNGFDLCRTLHRRLALPVILLTARGEAQDRIQGLDQGADDYVVKPFEPRELVARIHSVLRRRAAGVAATPAALPSSPVPPARLHFAGFSFEPDTGVLRHPNATAVRLSPVESRLLTVFLAHPRRLLRREQLIDLTTDPDTHVFDRAIDRQVSRLRRKLDDDARQSELLRTVWGDGYMLLADVTPTPA